MARSSPKIDRVAYGGLALVSALAIVSAAARIPPAAAARRPDGGASASASAQALRAEATNLFKRKKYAEACERFREAVAAAPDDAALLTDLGLCQHKLGRDSEAVASNLRAIELSSRDGKSLDDPATARVRRHAYFNLQLAGYAQGAIAGDSKGTTCAAVDAAPGCAQSFQACGYSANLGYRLRTFSRTSAKVALTPAGAAWTQSELADQGLDEPDLSALGQPPADKPQVVADGSLTFIARFEDDARTAGCEDLYAWSCASSHAVHAAARACLHAAAGGQPKSGSPYDACFAKACADLDKHPSPAVASEKRRQEKLAARCAVDVARNAGGTDYFCGIVYANACNGLLALACSGSAPGDDNATTRIDEYHFVTPSTAAAPH